MNIRVCLENLKYDLSNGGIEEDSFAMNCYITMAHEACRILKSAASRRDIDDAKEYIALCKDSGIGSLRCVIEE